MRTLLGSWRRRFADHWMTLDAGERAQRVGLLLAIAVYVAHYSIVFGIIQPFYIEDAGISFAYARNLVNGHGLVPFVGAERVEGYSNPLWVFLIAAAMMIKVDPWTSSKVMGAVFGGLGQIAAWALVRRARPGASPVAALAAPWLLAGSTQYVVWNSSGLENGLFSALLGLGMLAAVREGAGDSRFPWSALCFAGLSMTRPEGVVYAGLAFAVRALVAVVRGQWLAIPAWIVAFGAPWGAYNYWRYEYFQGWWPNTWYAKEKDFKPFIWTALGWKQIREYYATYWIVGAVPVMAAALSGLGRRGRWLALFLTALLAAVIFWDGRAGLPAALKVGLVADASRNWVQIRVWTILGSAVLLGLSTLGRAGWEARALAWASYAFGVFFLLIANGDWMRCYRWFSLAAVPQFTVIAIGLGEVADRLPRPDFRLAGRFVLRGLYVAVPTIALLVPDVGGSQKFVLSPETSPRDVHKRVNYMDWVAERLDLDHVTLMDVDMGAHLWYTDWWIVDMAGLIDVPIARHKYQKSFMTDYVFDEKRPEFAHVHGAWANTTGIPRIDRWKTEYMEIPGFASGKRALHVGNHVRKDLVAGRAKEATTAAAVRFADDLTADRIGVPAPTVAPGGELYVTSAWRSGVRESGFRVLLFLVGDGGVAWSAEVAPGFDWYKPPRWRPSEEVRGDWSVELPASLARGDYRLGMAVLDETTGAPIPVVGRGPSAESLLRAGQPEPEPFVPGPPVFVTGEWLSDLTVHLVSPEQAAGEADRRLAEAKAAAAAGDCEVARAAWKDAKRHVARNTRWKNEHRPEADEAIVGCLVGRARAEPDEVAAAAMLLEARKIEEGVPALLALAEPVAARLRARGDAARAAEDWQGAFTAYTALLNVEPWHPDVRKAAEEMRDKRLGVSGKEPEKAVRKAGKAKFPRPGLRKDKADEEADEAPEPPAEPEPEAVQPAGGDGVEE
jgi:hypothetical protein